MCVIPTVLLYNVDWLGYVVQSHFCIRALIGLNCFWMLWWMLSVQTLAQGINYSASLLLLCIFQQTWSLWMVCGCGEGEVWKRINCMSVWSAHGCLLPSVWYQRYCSVTTATLLSLCVMTGQGYCARKSDTYQSLTCTSDLSPSPPF